jgi:hypothetical protein
MHTFIQKYRTIKGSPESNFNLFAFLSSAILFVFVNQHAFYWSQWQTKLPTLVIGRLGLQKSISVLWTWSSLTVAWLASFRVCAVQCTVPAVLSDCTGRRLADWACRTGQGCHTPPPPGKCPRCHSHQCGAHLNWLDKKETVSFKICFKIFILYYVRTFTMIS